MAQNNYQAEVGTTIYVGGLPLCMTAQKLRTFFSKFGTVVRVKRIFHRETHKPERYGFVQFSETDAAYRAVTAEGRDVLYRGRRLTVRMAHSDFPTTPQSAAAQMMRNVQTERLNDEAPVEDLPSPASRLNDDSLIHIFGYLTPIERIAVERVCRQWQRCSWSAMKKQKHLKLVKQFNSFSAFTNYILRSILSRASCNLVSLDISIVCSRFDNRALEIISWHCQSIEKLNMPDMFYATNKGMENFTSRCRKIKWLNVVGCYSLSETGFWHIFKNCKQLEYLDCSGNPRFTGKCLKLAGCSFKSLLANNCKQLTNEGLTNLPRRCAQMEVLKLSGCDLLTYQTIVTVTKSLPSLTEISLGNIPCRNGQHRFAQHVVQQFVTPSIIVKLELFNCCLTDTDLLLICGRCSLVTELDISCNRLTDASVVQISSLKNLEGQQTRGDEDLVLPPDSVSDKQGSSLANVVEIDVFLADERDGDCSKTGSNNKGGSFLDSVKELNKATVAQPPCSVLSACHLYNITDASLMDVANLGKLRRLRLQGSKRLTDQLMLAVAGKCLHIEEVDVAGIPAISHNTLIAFLQSSAQRVGGPQLLFYTSYNDFDADVVLATPRSSHFSVIENYRPLYSVRLVWEPETAEEAFLLQMQNIELEGARMNNPVYQALYQGLGGWRINQAQEAPDDLLDDWDDIEDDFEIFMDIGYLDNDYPLLEDLWFMS